MYAKNLILTITFLSKIVNARFIIASYVKKISRRYLMLLIAMDNYLT